MMKKLSKIALLAAASAFMLAVFPACGDDDEDNDPPPSVTKASVKIFNQKEEDITGKTDVAMKTEDVLNVQAIPSDFPDGEVTYGWVSGTATIAKVEQNSTNKAQAQITAVAAGTAKITVTVTVGDTTATADITVTVTTKDGESQTSQPSVKIFNQQGEEDITGKTDVAMKTEDFLNVQAIPSDFPDGDVDYEWVSDTATVARVDQNPGNKAQAQVTALAAGSAKITVTAKSGETEKSATFTVTVTAKGSGTEPVTPPPASDAVTAVWDFATSPEGFPTSDGAADAITDFNIAPNSGSGATLTATGRWKYQSAPASLQAQASSNKTVADAAEWTTDSGGKWLTLTLEGDATVTIKYAGAGGADAKRFVAVVDADKTVKFASAEAGIDGTELTETLVLVKGTYTIAMNGSRIFSISCAGSAN